MNNNKISFMFLIVALLFANSLQATNGNSSEVFTFAEQMPQFPDGEREMFKFLTENIQLPIEVQLRGIQGRVVCQFVVNSDGSISDIKVVRGLDSLLDAEVVRVIESMPKWIPGKQNGEAVNVQYTLPVRFQIEAWKIREDVFEEVEQMPEFPGGNQALMQFLNSNIRYPMIAQERGIQGRVVVQFVVNVDGSIVDIQVVRSVHRSLDREAVRLIQSMPKWTPGKIDGEAVRVKFTLPIHFQIEAQKIVEVQETLSWHEMSVDDITQLLNATTYRFGVLGKRNEFIEVEQPPEFPGGFQALMRFIEQNLRYPIIAQKDGIQGRVAVQFVVDVDGSIVDIQVVQSVHRSLDREAVRLIQSMPKWTPGKIDGEAVRVKFTLPIVFRVN